MACITFDHPDASRIVRFAFGFLEGFYRLFLFVRATNDSSTGTGRMAENTGLFFIGLSLRFLDLEQIDSSCDILDLLAVLDDQEIDRRDGLSIGRDASQRLSTDSLQQDSVPHDPSYPC